MLTTSTYASAWYVQFWNGKTQEQKSRPLPEKKIVHSSTCQSVLEIVVLTCWTRYIVNLPVGPFSDVTGAGVIVAVVADELIADELVADELVADELEADVADVTEKLWIMYYDWY
jgi:hypothetical protein